MASVIRENPKINIAELQAALAAETESRFELERRLKVQEEEFTSFLLMAVHDLREPLRAVTVYSQMLSREESVISGEQPDKLLGHIREGASKMGMLMAGIVDFAAAGEPIPDQL